MGAFFIVGGTCINYFSYRIAVNANASFFYLFWGIVVVGLLMLVRAFFFSENKVGTRFMTKNFVTNLAD